MISGLIEKRHPGQEKTGRQVTVSADLIYDVLRSHEPDHILLRATRADAAAGLLDVRRLADMLSRIKGRIMHKDLERISPLAVPIMMEIGKEAVVGEANDMLLSEAADDLSRRQWGRHDGTASQENSPARSRSQAKGPYATSAACSIFRGATSLVVSDLHLEKGAAFARRGSLVPPYDTAATLDRLSARDRSLSARCRHQPGRLLPRPQGFGAHAGTVPGCASQA